MFQVDRISTQETDIRLHLLDLGYCFGADGDLGAFRDLVAYQYYLDIGVMHVLQDSSDTTGNKSSFQLGWERPGHFKDRRASACQDEHTIADKADGLLGNSLLLALGIDFTRGKMDLAEGMGQCPTVNFDHFAFLRQFLEIAPDRIFRNVDVRR